MKEARNFLIAVLAGILLAGCAAQPHVSATDLPGFASGFWHGFTMPVAFVGSLFLDVHFYAFPNNGWPYDLGFLSGASILGAIFFSPYEPV